MFDERFVNDRLITNATPFGFCFCPFYDHRVQANMSGLISLVLALGGSSYFFPAITDAFFELKVAIFLCRHSDERNFVKTNFDSFSVH